MKLKNQRLAETLFLLLNALWLLALATGFVLLIRNDGLWRFVLFDGQTVSESDYQIDAVRMLLRPILISGTCLFAICLSFYIVAAASMLCVRLLFTPDVATSAFRRISRMRANDRLWRFTFRKLESFFRDESAHDNDPDQQS